MSIDAFPLQDDISRPEQNEAEPKIHEILEEAQQRFLEDEDLTDEDNSNRLSEFMLKRGELTDILRREGIDFQSLEAWHRVVSGPSLGKATVYDTSDGMIEKYVREILLPILKFEEKEE